jgi:hypothetical protein
MPEVPDTPLKFHLNLMYLKCLKYHLNLTILMFLKYLMYLKTPLVPLEPDVPDLYQLEPDEPLVPLEVHLIPHWLPLEPLMYLMNLKCHLNLTIHLVPEAPSKCH